MLSLVGVVTTVTSTITGPVPVPVLLLLLVELSSSLQEMIVKLKNKIRTYLIGFTFSSKFLHGKYKKVKD